MIVLMYLHTTIYTSRRDMNGTVILPSVTITASGTNKMEPTGFWFRAGLMCRMKVLLMFKAQQLWTSTAWTCVHDTHAHHASRSSFTNRLWSKTARCASPPSKLQMLPYHEAALRRMVDHQSKWHKHLQMLFSRLRTIKRMIAGQAGLCWSMAQVFEIMQKARLYVVLATCVCHM